MNIVVGIFEGLEGFPVFSIPVPYEKHGRSLIAPVAFVKLQNRTHTNGEVASIDRPMESPGGVRMPHVVVCCIDVISFINSRS